MSLYIESEIEVSFSFDWEALAREVIDFSIEHEAFPYEAEVNLTLTDNAGIREINKSYREIDRSTDVLSFPMWEEDDSQSDVAAGDIDPANEAVMLGDIVISAEKAVAQAAEYGHSPEREFAFLAVHSTLHLLGYDHETSAEEEAYMIQKQEDVLTAIGVPRI